MSFTARYILIQLNLYMPFHFKISWVFYVDHKYPMPVHCSKCYWKRMIISTPVFSITVTNVLMYVPASNLFTRHDNKNNKNNNNRVFSPELHITWELQRRMLAVLVVIRWVIAVYSTSDWSHIVKLSCWTWTHVVDSETGLPWPLMRQ